MYWQGAGKTTSPSLATVPGKRFFVCDMPQEGQYKMGGSLKVGIPNHAA